MELDEDVLEMVRTQLERDPPPSTTALYGRAVRINSDIYELSLRQFHAKYPLRVKREQARESRGAGTDGAGEAREGEAAGGQAADEEPVPDDAGRRHLFGGRDAPAGGPDDEAPSAEAAGPARSSGADGDGGGGPGPDGAVRESLRRLFWRLARDVAAADRPEEVVDLVSGMPRRVDEAVHVVTGQGGEGR